MSQSTPSRWGEWNWSTEQYPTACMQVCKMTAEQVKLQLRGMFRNLVDCGFTASAGTANQQPRPPECKLWCGLNPTSQSLPELWIQSAILSLRLCDNPLSELHTAHYSTSINCISPLFETDRQQPSQWTCLIFSKCNCLWFHLCKHIRLCCYLCFDLLIRLRFVLRNGVCRDIRHRCL